MKVKGESLLKGLTGRVQNLVVRELGGQTIVSVRPDMSRRKLSAKQKEANDKMQTAVAIAQHMIKNSQLKLRAAKILKVPPESVYHGVIKEYLLSGGKAPLFKLREEEDHDLKTLSNLKAIIKNEIPDGEIKLYGDRAKGNSNLNSDWDFLVLTANEYPSTVQWELQEKLFAITRPLGARVNLLVVQKDKWLNEPEYQLLRERVEK